MADKKLLTIALGTVFSEDQSPENLISDLEKLIAQKEMLEELGYDIEINRSEEIYELVFTKKVEFDGVLGALTEVKELLPKELYPFVFKHSLISDDCDQCGRTFSRGQYVTGLIDENNPAAITTTKRWAARIGSCYRCAHEQPVAYRFETKEEAEEFIRNGVFSEIENLKIDEKDIINDEILYFEYPQLPEHESDRDNDNYEEE